MVNANERCRENERNVGPLNDGEETVSQNDETSPSSVAMQGKGIII